MPSDKSEQARKSLSESIERAIDYHMREYLIKHHEIIGILEEMKAFLLEDMLMENIEAEDEDEGMD